MEVSYSKFVNSIPKVELHVHIEGSIGAKTILALINKNKIDFDGNAIEDIHQWFNFVDFDNFSKVYRKVSKCLQTVDDIELAMREFLQDRYDQNILYTEAIYTPYTHYIQKGIPYQDQIDALTRARHWAREKLGVDSRIIIDISRQESSDSGELVAKWAISSMDQGVVALGLGGPEVGNPPEKFKKAFALAKSAGLPAVPHAGETVGPQSIWGAINELSAVRIGHGVRCIEDTNLVNELIRSRIPLDVCLTSNICLGVFKKIEDHPVRKLFLSGINLTINSDDPSLFSTSLTNELYLLMNTHLFKPHEIISLQVNAINSSFLSAGEKRKLLEKFNTEIPVEMGDCLP
jgi:adenosine deaminase